MNVAEDTLLWNEELRVVAEELEYLISTGAVDVGLLEQLIPRIFLLLSVLLDLLVGTRLLRPELVAGEGKNFESFLCVLCID
jgi:hypothetical protein